ncbi:diacylglycerol kinase family protein [Olsenella uli]|uniref:diacylglycerol kinase family protein n=1 Tax=Olsenella uli TaxID=133926 RepID=UPI00195CC76F|nr:diacylglycerol kinase family protein [Olsenella uli]MBM6676756.1 diacylglycerol kinase family protein [Olsenella uli]
MIPGSKSDHPGFRKSFLFAIQGFRTAVATERNIKVMLATGACAVVAGLALQLDLLSWAIILLCCGVVIMAELLNTAVETVVDLVSPEFHPLAGRAKDIAAAAVWVLSVIVAIVGVLVFANAIIARL